MATLKALSYTEMGQLVMANLDNLFINLRDNTFAPLFGRDASLLKKSGGGYDPETGTTTPPTETATNIKISIMEFTTYEKATLVDYKIDDMKINLLSGVSYGDNDSFIIDSNRYELVETINRDVVVEQSVMPILWLRKNG